MTDCLIRNPRCKKESRRALDLLNICFPKMNRKYFVKRILDDPGYRLTNTYIIALNDRIVSHAQVFDRKIFWGNKSAKFLGLGFICTAPEHRNKGHATRILNHIIKTKKNCIFGLFTKIPDYYSNLGFKVVPRKKINIVKIGFIKSPDFRIKIRKFNATKDIRPLMRIHKAYFHGQPGVINRNLYDWKSQLSYFNEEKNLFLVAEKDGKIKAYIRCKLIKPSNDKAEIVEYASINRDKSLITDFIIHLFNNCGINKVKGWDHFLKHALKYFPNHKEETDNKMMLKFNGRYRQSDIKSGELCFLESDGF